MESTTTCQQRKKKARRSELVKVKLEGHFKTRIGKEELELEAKSIKELVASLSRLLPEVADAYGNPSGLCLILIGDADYRVYGENPALSEEDVVTVIPVSHGG